MYDDAEIMEPLTVEYIIKGLALHPPPHPP